MSGEPPTEPVVSPKSGSLFEKRLILKYIAEHGKDPISGDDLAESDLITIKNNSTYVKPRPPTATSIPALLSTLQNEWDATMLETFDLKQKYHQARQELTTVLYQHDAACRVIARLTRERDEARRALANVRESLVAAGGAAAASKEDRMEVDERPLGEAEGLTQEILEKMNETSAQWVHTSVYERSEYFYTKGNPLGRGGAEWCGATRPAIRALPTAIIASSQLHEARGARKARIDLSKPCFARRSYGSFAAMPCYSYFASLRMDGQLSWHDLILDTLLSFKLTSLLLSYPWA